MPTYVRLRPWMETTRCNRYHGDSPKNKESPVYRRVHLTHTYHTGRTAWLLPWPVHRTAAGSRPPSLNGADLCLFRQSVTPRSVIAVIMRPRVTVDSMVIRGGRKSQERDEANPRVPLSLLFSFLGESSFPSFLDLFRCSPVLNFARSFYSREKGRRRKSASQRLP